MILPILSYGSPILRKECDEFDGAINKILFDIISKKLQEQSKMNIK